MTDINRYINESREVVFELDGETVVMRPTYLAASRISKHFGGYGPATQALANADINAVEVIIAHGLGLTPHGQKGLGEKIFNTGIMETLGPCVAFINVLTGADKQEEATGTEGEA